MEKLIQLVERIEKKLENHQDDTVFTRKKAQEYYKLSKREVDKIFNRILKDKIVDIGKEQRLAKVHIDKLFRDGIVLK